MPSNVEFTVLANYLGGNGVAGGKMKSTTGAGVEGYCENYNAGATNESGFTAIPGGFRDGSCGAYQSNPIFSG